MRFHVGPIAPPVLRKRLIEAMGIGFLREDIDRRLLKVTTVSRDAVEGYSELKLLFEDEFIGGMEGILLVPAGKGPFPAVIALHGHGGNAAQYRDEMRGSDFAKRGYVILMLTMRASDPTGSRTGSKNQSSE